MSPRIAVNKYIGILCVLSLLTVSPLALADDACHPAVKRASAQFIVGYGSLMQSESRHRTAPDADEGHPVMITGFQRSWNFRGPSSSPTTYLGILPKAGARMNTLIYSIPAEEVLATDEREDGYCRIPVTSKQMKMLDSSDEPAGQVWIYAISPERSMPPDQDFPIVQSYVDVFIGGCIEIGDANSLPDFAADCIRTTHGWSPYWVNDRLMPRRPFVYQPLARRIDVLLGNALPDLLKKRKIE